MSHSILPIAYARTHHYDLEQATEDGEDLNSTQLICRTFSAPSMFVLSRFPVEFRANDAFNRSMDSSDNRTF